MKYLFVLGAVLFCFTALHAQRKIDLEVSMVSPSNNQIILPFTTVPISINLTNNGPDTLILGDTVWYNTSLKPLFSYDFFTVGSTILPGSSVLFHIAEIKNAQSSEFHDTAQFCVRVTDRSGVPGLGQGSYIDTSKSNNINCNEIIIQSTAVEHTLFDDKIHVFPNPTSQVIFIETSNYSTTFNYSITDLGGRIVKEGILVSNNNIANIDVTQLPNAMYQLNVSSRNMRQRSTLFIKK